MAESNDCTGEISSFSAIFLGVLNGVSGFAAVVGNLFVLVTFIKSESLRQPCYYLMVSLASMDILVGLAVNPLYIALTNFIPWQYREEHLLQLESFFAMTSSMIIMHNLTVMSVERYIAVTYSLRYRTLVTDKRSYIAIAFVWTFGFTLNGLYFGTSNDDLPKLWITCGVLIGFVPIAIIFYCYAKIFRAARRQSRRIAVAERCVSNTGSRNDREESTDIGSEKSNLQEAKRARKAAWGVAIAFLIVMVLSMPVTVISILQIVYAGDVCRRRSNNRAWFWGATITLISSALDPWIYAMRIREFRQCFKRAFRFSSVLLR